MSFISIFRFVILCILLFFVSCETTNVVVQPPAPEWYVNPPADSTLGIYGSGTSYSRDQAVKLALNNIASKISVQVSSDISIRDESISSNGQENYLSSTQQNIQNKVKELTINNYFVEEAVELNQRYYVLVRVDKNVLAEEKKILLDDLSTRMDGILRNAQGDELIFRIQSLRKIQGFISEGRSLALVLKSLRPSEDIRSYLSRFSEYELMYDEAIQSIEWYIDVDLVSAPFEKILRDKITEEGYRISSSRDVDNVNQLVIVVRSTVVHSERSSRYYSKLMTDFSVESEGRSFSNIHKECFGSSSLNSSQALLNASYQMLQETESGDILRFLGVE